MASDITAPSDYDKVIVQEIETRDASHSSPELLNSHRIFSEESWKNSMAVKTLLKVSRSSHDYCFSPLFVDSKVELPNSKLSTGTPQHCHSAQN